MKKFLAILLVLTLALTGAALAEAAPEESGVVLYTSDLGYTIGLPDESWFNLNAETYAQYADDPAFSTIFSFLNISTENIDEVTASMDYFYTTDSGANINVQVLPAISDEDYEMTPVSYTHLAEQIVQRGLLLVLDQSRAQFILALLGHAAGEAVVVHGGDDVARLGHVVEADDLHRVGGQRLLDALAAVVDHGAHAAIGRTGDDGIAHAQRAGLDQHRGHRAAALVQTGLDDDLSLIHI